jgi:hypothetical protein
MERPARIFISYVREDSPRVEKLYLRLREEGFLPWMDKFDLLPGDVWARAIEWAMNSADFFLCCLSSSSVRKRGFVQQEIHKALDIWHEKLEDDIYFIPVLLEDIDFSAIPIGVLQFQFVSLHEQQGLEKLLRALREGVERRKQVVEAIRHEAQEIQAPTQATRAVPDVGILERCRDLEEIRNIHQRWHQSVTAGAAPLFLQSFDWISRDLDAALNWENVYHQRLALQKVEGRLASLLRELVLSNDLNKSYFYQVAESWRRLVGEKARELAEPAKQSEEIDSPYVIGPPLNAQQEVFVGRTDLGLRLEKMLLGRQCPPLLLYGQRRMGKTSLLLNLGRLLPRSIIPLYVSLQGAPAASTTHESFFYNLAGDMLRSASSQGLSLPQPSREFFAGDPFSRFNEWLDEIENALGDRSILLELDEFETIERAFTDGRLDEVSVLGMFRHIIQHRPRFRVLLAGAHTLDEFRRWAGYLINVQTVKLSYLKKEEARELIEYPVKDFKLRYEPEASLRVLDVTRGHPFLLQLLCEEIVALKNERPLEQRFLARIDDVEASLPEALGHGSMVFADIEYNQIDISSLKLLRFLAAKGEGGMARQEELARVFADECEPALDLLLRRDLIEPVNGGFRFQVEMIRRWFARTSMPGAVSSVAKYLPDRVSA